MRGQNNSLASHIPNIITLCNLAIGALAVLMALENQVVFASWLILLAALLDFLDGFLARALDAMSMIGKQLDSLADLISFGMAPTAIVYKLMEFSIRGDIFYSGIQDFSLPERFLLFAPIMLVLFAAIRLAEFNIQQDPSKFYGMPTPAAAIYFAGGCIFLVNNIGSLLSNFILQPIVLLANIVIISLLMIVRIPLFSLKFHDFRWKGNEIRYIFLAISCILLIILQEIALPVIILIYLLLSITVSLIRKD
ncbi:CDP-alcohol phosphatidyltransferase family protein [Bacteroidota bacterium]